MKLSRFLLFALIPVFLCGVGSVSAQSTDQSLPTPVLANEISGTISALDLGDPRLTRHYYAFEGTPGDLLITIESRNLNVDVDVFTAITFRPLMKASLYAESSQEVTKGIYLRSNQILILRVEGRTPNDDPGRYQIRFGGTFAKFSGGIPVAEPQEVAESSESEKSGANRLSSTGANVPRPPSETVEPEAKPTPEETAESKAAPAAKPRTTSRRTTSRNPRRTTRTAPAKPPVKKTDAEQSAETSSTGEPAKPAEIAPAGAHLVVERKDGTVTDRPMTTVRRVVVEGSAIVIFLKSGKIERIPMDSVAKMTIEPRQ